MKLKDPMKKVKQKIKKGNKFTIQGFGIGVKGQFLINGINLKTRRKCKSVKEAVFTKQ